MSDIIGRLRDAAARANAILAHDAHEGLNTDFARMAAYRLSEAADALEARPSDKLEAIAGGGEVRWQHRGRRRGSMHWSEWCDGRNQNFDTADGEEFEERRVRLVPIATPVSHPDGDGVRPLSEWSEDVGNVVWWALGDDGQWFGEPAYIGSPLDRGQTIEIELRSNQGEFIQQHQVGGWPGYHTHWTPHPKVPAPPAALKSPSGQTEAGE